MQLKDTLASLSAILEDKIPNLTIYGLAEQIDKDGMTFPAYHDDMVEGDLIAISPDDTIAAQVYYRHMDSTVNNDAATGYGAKTRTVVTHNMRLVCFTQWDMATENDFLKAMPVSLPGGFLIQTSSVVSEAKKVIAEEYNNTRVRHVRPDIYLFYIDFNLTQNCL